MVKPQQGKRISKVDMYLNCAETFAYRSTCLKRKYGAVIVKDDVVISTGYNGSPRGFDSCCDWVDARGWKEICIREKGMGSAGQFTQRPMLF